MKRLRAFLAMLLPVLMLAATVCSALESQTVLSWAFTTNILTYSEQETRPATQTDSQLPPASFRIHRRASAHVPFFSVALPSVVLVINNNRTILPVFFKSSSDAIDILAHAWQFDCRAAIPPRVP